MSVNRAKTAGRTYSAEVHSEAVTLYREHGPREAARRLARRLGGDGPTAAAISKWAKAEGVPAPWRDATSPAAMGAERKWRNRRLELAETYGDASGEALTAARGAVASGKASDAKAFMLSAAIASSKADELSGIAREVTVHHLVVDMAEAQADLERALGIGQAIDTTSSVVEDDG